MDLFNVPSRRTLRRNGGLIALQVYEKKGKKCELCQKTDDLTFHHIDGWGRKSKKPNNIFSNLQLLCRSCHGKIDSKRATHIGLKGKDHPNYGKKASIETRLKQSLAKKGKPRVGNPENWVRTPETRLKIGLASRGRKYSLETRKKLSEIRKREWDLGIRKYNHIHTIEEKRKRSQSIKEWWRVRKELINVGGTPEFSRRTQNKKVSH